MANKIITVGEKTNTSSKYNLEVYRDISMVGNYKRNKKLYKNTFECFIRIYDDNQHGLLQTEKNNNNSLIKTNWKKIEYIDKENNDNNQEIIKNSQLFYIDKLVNVYAVFNSIHNIFHWIPGERILNPEFGSKLYTLLYNGITPFTIEQIIAEIRHCISRWEPRVNIINIVNVSNTNDTENNTIQLDIIFSIPSLDNNQYKYSYTYNKKSD